MLDEYLPDGVACVTTEPDKADLWSLVLQAVDIPHRVVRRDGDWLITVEEGFEDKARFEIASFEEENAGWPPLKENSLDYSAMSPDNHPPTVLIMGMLVVFYSVTGPWSDSSEWFRQGAIMSGRILKHGEWWRVVTSLTLHAGPVHVFGNVLVGGTVVHFLCRVLGSGLAWALVLFSGVLGNTINVFMHGGEHRSVGFSTAVFGAIGLLSGLRAVRFTGLKDLFLPLGAGLGLLAMLGSEGERTDLGAHLWGLVAGFGLGILAFHLNILKKEVLSRMTFLLFFSALVVLGCWWRALHG